MQTLSGYLFLFLIIFWISFAGSLQVGLVNIRVMLLGLTRGRKQAIFAAMGGSVPEFVYAFAAGFAVLKTTDYFAAFSRSIGLISGIVLMVAGLFMILSAPQKTNSNFTLNNPKSSVNSHKPFLQGLFLAFINPQLLLFWSAIASQQKAPSQGNQLIWLFFFGLGAALGAFALLIVIALFSHKLSKQITPFRLRMIARMTGLLLLLGGVFVFGKTIIYA